MESSTTDALLTVGNTGGHASSALYKCSLYYFIVGTCFGGTILLVGFIGNGCTLVIMRKERKKSSTVNCLFLLAIVDILVLMALTFLVFPIGLRKFFFGWWSGHNYNHVTTLYVAEMLHIFNQVSALLTILVTFQRYISICRPLKAKQLCTVKRVNQMAALSAIASFVFYCPRFFTSKVITGGNGRFTFSTSQVITSPFYSYFYLTIATALVAYILPLASLTFMSVSILLALKKKVGPERATTQLRKDLTISSITIVGIFITCQSFVFIRKVLEWNFHPISKYTRCQGSLQFYSLTHFIAMMINSSANFFVFVYFSKGFRRKLMRRKLQPANAEAVVTCTNTDNIIAGTSMENETDNCWSKNSSSKTQAQSDENN